MSESVYISKKTVKKIVDHCQSERPIEGCGILLGTRAVEGTRITDALEAKNVLESPSRYEVDPFRLHFAHKIADLRKLEVVGYYHSHPSHPCSPSLHDVEGAIDGGIYIIVSFLEGESICCWRWDEASSRFALENLIIE